MPTSSKPLCFLAALLTIALLCLLSSVSADEWTYGRATFYDDNQQGSCQYFNNIPEWYGAWPDSMSGFPNCGSCWEVSCVNSDFNDGYGAKCSRNNACYDTSKSVVIKIVDSCPCVHQNFYSNQRWCCGDMNHLDLGRRAFQELADERLGVIGLRWKPASCDQLGPRAGGSQPPAPPADNGNQGNDNSNSNGGLNNGNDGSNNGGSNNSGSNNSGSNNGNDGGNNGGWSHNEGWGNWGGWSKPKQRSFGEAFARGWMGQGW